MLPAPTSDNTSTKIILNLIISMLFLIIILVLYYLYSKNDPIITSYPASFSDMKCTQISDTEFLCSNNFNLKD